MSSENISSLMDSMVDRSATDGSNTAEKAMERIFDNSDPEGTGYASVSALIDFMTPYMQANLSDLQRLREILDPVTIDPKIDRLKFYNAMQEWSNIVKGVNADPCLTPPRELVSSTKSTEELIYTCGSTPSPLTTKSPDHSFELVAAIEKLKLKNRKLSETIGELKSELTQSEELNNVLQNNNIKLLKQVKLEQQNAEMIKKLRQECDDYRESDTNSRKEIAILKQKCKQLSVENLKYLEDCDELRLENQQLFRKIEQYQDEQEQQTKLLADAKSKIVEITTELEERKCDKMKAEEEMSELEAKIKFLEESVKCRRSRESKKSRAHLPTRRKTVPRPQHDPGSTLSVPTIETSYEKTESDPNSSGESGCSLFFTEEEEGNSVSLLSELKNASQGFADVDHIRCSNEIKDLEDKLLKLEETIKQQTEEINLYKSKIFDQNEELNKLHYVEKGLSDIDRVTYLNEIKDLEDKILKLEETLIQQHEDIIKYESKISNQNEELNKLRNAESDKLQVSLNDLIQDKEEILNNKYNMEEDNLEIVSKMKMEGEEVLREKSANLEKENRYKIEVNNRNAKKIHRLRKILRIKSNLIKTTNLQLTTFRKESSELKNLLTISKQKCELLEKEHRLCNINCQTNVLLNKLVGEKTLEVKALKDQLKITESDFKMLQERLSKSQVSFTESTNNQRIAETISRHDRQAGWIENKMQLEDKQNLLAFEKEKNNKFLSEFNVIRNETKEISSSKSKDELNEFIQENEKLKSYLQETSNQLLEIKQRAHSILSSEYFIQINWEQECGDVVKINKSEYFEEHIITFHQKLCQCIYLLLIVTDTKQLDSHDENRISRSCKRVLGTSKGTNTQVPFSKPVTNDCNRRSSYPFLKGSPQSPDSPSTFAVPNENMGEPCTLQIQPPNAIEGNLLKNLNNNNMSPDSASLSNGENADINSNSIPVDSSGVISMGDDGTESKKLFTRNSWGEVGQTTRRLSSISALSTNSGSTESLSIDNDQQPEHKSSPEIKPPNSVENNTHNILIQTQQPSLEETDDEKEIEVFPSIPDAFLINLQCASSVEVEDDEYKCEEVEQRYLALSFAFNTDSKSVHQRKGRLQKFRDQAEHNLQMESEKLLKLVHKLNPWCLDVERFELVSNIRNQINIMMEAAKTVSTCSYNLGAVCQEQRLNKAVQLMLKYVETIKMQRDTARRRFKYTSRMLQESTSSTPRKPESPPPKTTNTPPSNNNRLMTRRRASIATIPRPAPVLNDNTTRSAPVRRPTLRSLDLSPVARIETVDRLPFRTSRSSRSELAVGELQKIGENDASDNESDVEVPAPTVELETNPPNDTRLRPSLAICNFFRRYLGDNFHHSGLFYEVCTTLALVCIFMAVTQLGSILLEIEYARQGLPVPWWPSLNELLEFFEGYGIFNIRTDITD